MRLSLLWLPLLAVAAVFPGFACARAPDALDAGPYVGVEGPNASIAFQTKGPLTLAPGEIRAITVVGTPAAEYAMTFVLLGDSLDASLDATTVIADDTGLATVNLRAPEAPATFQLRASIENGPSAEISVAVSGKGFGQVHVLPIYTGGRSVTEWTASVVAHTTCAAIAQILPDEPPGALITNAAYGDMLIVDGAPVGPNLAVAVRSGHSMWGCADTTDLVAGSTIDVNVNVLDKPVVTTATDLDVDFAYAPDPMPYAALLADATDLLAEGFFPSGTSDGKTLLDAMHSSVPSNATAQFDAFRKTKGWDELADDYLAAHNISLSDAAKSFVAAGLIAEPQEILGHLASIGEGPGQARLTIKRLGSIDAASAGIPSDNLVAWSADPNDNLLLGGTLYWWPSRFVGSVAESGAAALMPTGSSVDSALASIAQCSVLGPLLGEITGCDGSCMANACSNAIAARWQIGLEASASSDLPGQITITASGRAVVDDTAIPVSFSGSWLGTVSVGTANASVQGAAAGTVPEPN